MHRTCGQTDIQVPYIGHYTVWVDKSQTITVTVVLSPLSESFIAGSISHSTQGSVQTVQWEDTVREGTVNSILYRTGGYVVESHPTVGVAVV